MLQCDKTPICLLYSVPYMKLQCTLKNDLCYEKFCSGSRECMEKVDMLEMRQPSGSQVI